MSEHFFSGARITLSLWQHAFFGSLQVAPTAAATLRSRTCSGVIPLALGVRIFFGMEHSLSGTQLWTKKNFRERHFLSFSGCVLWKNSKNNFDKNCGIHRWLHKDSLIGSQTFDKVIKNKSLEQKLHLLSQFLWFIRFKSEFQRSN